MTRSDVKIGDKVRVVNPWGTQGQYKKGDVLTVRMVAESGIAVEETYRVLLHDEYEPYEPIKVGDTVTLIDNFYDHEKFKGDKRYIRKQIARLKGKKFEVKYITLPHSRVSTGEIDYSIPIELLEKVEQLPKEPKKGDLFRVIGNDGHRFHSVGDIVEFKGEFGDRSYTTYCPKTGRTQFVHITDLEPYTVHRHTPDQIAEAQRIIGEIVAGFKYGQCFYIRDESDKELTIRYTAEIADGMHTITAHRSPHDEFNRTIGIMVALCKATGRKLPDWV